ncbi:carbohydrate porin [Roseibacillus ishigakijimensis]|uniref:Carbohydrate porin n=1 Tax=Roseibacillus ishigakijimensis TaxID=454146 RepID=A0A934VNP5_9BACT|nr:carbohydrate porin [Roseibacillus ishigakijimensis]MBK1835291.1 carbohydrate porin [Roseibacillus ishigakijimensis]
MAAIVFTQPLRAENDFNVGDYLTRDWGGLRPQLVDSGITPFLYYDSIFSANLSGGIRHDEDFVGQVYAGVDLDLETLWGWEGTTMKVSMVNRHGNTLSDSVGGIYDPMTIYGGQVSYLYQLFIEKEFGDDWSLKFGRVSADTDFTKSSLFGYSLSTAINGPIRATLLESSLTSFPYPVWGARLKYTPDEEHKFQLGAYQTGPDQWDYRKHGADFSFGNDDGISVLAQYDWTPRSQPGTRIFGGVIGSFRDFERFDGGERDFLFRAYLHAEGEIAPGLTAFALATYSPQDEVALTPWQLSAGLNYAGLFPGREADRTFFFATYGQLSDEYGDAIGEDVDYEMVYELGHRFQLTPAVYFQPSLQYIQNPGGTGHIDDAVVLGAWLNLSF